MLNSKSDVKLIEALQSENEALRRYIVSMNKVVSELLNCTELNLDDLEPDTKIKLNYIRELIICNRIVTSNFTQSIVN